MIVTETITHFRTLTEPATFRHADCGVPTTTTNLKLPSTAVTVYQVSVETHVASRRTEHVEKRAYHCVSPVCSTCCQPVSCFGGRK